MDEIGFAWAVLIFFVVCSVYNRDFAVPTSKSQSSPPQQCCFTEEYFVLWDNCSFEAVLKYRAAFVLWIGFSSCRVLEHWKHCCWTASVSCKIAQIWLCIKTHIIDEPVKAFKKSDTWKMMYFLSTASWHLDLFGWCCLPLSMLS